MKRNGQDVTARVTKPEQESGISSGAGRELGAAELLKPLACAEQKRGWLQGGLTGTNLVWSLHAGYDECGGVFCKRLIPEKAEQKGARCSEAVVNGKEVFMYKHLRYSGTS